MPNLTAKSRTMIVDDDPVLIRMMARALESFGHVPVAFMSSEEAFEAFRSNPEQFDLVVTDGAMPTLNGSELASRIRALRPELPILLVTGSQARDYEASTDISGLLEKPFSSREFKLVIETLLSGSSLLAIG